MKKIAIGADIGGSHITCQLYDLEKHELLEGSRVRVSVDSHASKEVILEAWCSAISLAAETYDIADLAGIGFAMPGPFDYPGGIALFEGVNKFDDLKGVNVREAIQQHFGLPATYPVRFLNDASCFAIGESFSAVSFRRFLAITLGTGFGACFIRDHLPVAGEDGASEDGYLYHLPFGESNADNHFSTRWFKRIYREKAGREIEGVRELTQLYDSDPIVKEIFNTFGTNLGLFTASWLDSFRAEGLVIGGNISQAHPYFREALETAFLRKKLSVKLVISGLQEDAALSGSANLCDNGLYEKLI
jgi:glucokinase